MRVERGEGETGVIVLAGRWTMDGGLPSADEGRRRLEAGRPVARLAFETRGVTAWDTGLLAFVSRLREWGRGRGIETDLGGLPEGVQRLLQMAERVPPRPGGRETARPPWLARVGTASQGAWAASVEITAFVGEVALAGLALLRGRARFQPADLFLAMQACGAQALPIVTLISFLVGLILAFVGSVQLRPFGAQIFVANLVGVAMAQEMGAMMAAIIMAGRSGASFAAQIGTMQVNEEVDALRTMGLSPVEFLVLPRALALALMMPLLTVYADLLGILGGAFVGITMLDLTPIQYFNQTTKALTLTHFAMGLVKGTVYGVLVALAGCLRGMQCGRSSAAVGVAVTSAVVSGIVCIITASSLLTFMYHVLGF
jgi:phospholipid/cholesterol/gamma-HCH transport system permease protein